jgi:hypothetical protein
MAVEGAKLHIQVAESQTTREFECKTRPRATGLEDRQSEG